MNSNEVYKKKFEELAAIEEKAMQLYKYYVDRVKDPFLLEKFGEIYRDEVRHFKMAKDFVKLIS